MNTYHINITYLLIILFVTLAFLTSCQVSYHPIRANKIEWFYSTRKINKILIDTRSKNQYDNKHLENAIHVPINSKHLKDDVLSKFKKKPKDVWVLFVYSHTREETSVMMEKLKKTYSYYWPFSGPTAIFYLQGGFLSWSTLKK